MNRLREDAAPKTFDEEIDEAALEIEEAADEFAKVPPAFRDLALSLAELMKKLADAAREGDREGIITHSRAIADVVKKMQAIAKPYVKTCKDARLADTIAVAQTAGGSFATQLKILAGVKAASVGRDAAAEK